VKAEKKVSMRAMHTRCEAHHVVLVVARSCNGSAGRR
jgi:hypothetical protein